MDKNSIIEVYKNKLKFLRDNLLKELEILKNIIVDTKSSKNDIKKAVEKAEQLISKFKWIITEFELKITKSIEKKSIENDENFLNKLDLLLEKF